MERRGEKTTQPNSSDCLYDLVGRMARKGEEKLDTSVSPIIEGKGFLLNGDAGMGVPDAEVKISLPDNSKNYPW